MRSELRKARISSGFTVEELADIVNISTSFYYKLEEGQRNPTITLAGRLAKVLGDKVELLFFNDNMDRMSGGQNVKCMKSDCFDRQSICCRVCDVKRCRFRCDLAGKSICEYQSI